MDVRNHFPFPHTPDASDGALVDTRINLLILAIPLLSAILGGFLVTLR